MFRLSSWIFYRGVPGFATDFPCGLWCAGLTPFLFWNADLFLHSTLVLSFHIDVVLILFIKLVTRRNTAMPCSWSAYSIAETLNAQTRAMGVNVGWYRPWFYVKVVSLPNCVEKRFMSKWSMILCTATTRAHSNMGMILIPFICDYGPRIIPKYGLFRIKHFLYLIIWSIFVSIHN